mgnify:CR=1
MLDHDYFISVQTIYTTIQTKNKNTKGKQKQFSGMRISEKKKIHKCLCPSCRFEL